MEITEVRVKLVDGGQDKLRAFCSITIDDSFVVRDLKIIEGNKGLFVAMPSRKLTTRCQRCGFKNQVRSHYCNDCGVSLPPEASQRLEGKGKLHADIAHPINTECREQLQSRVVESYLGEVDASQQPGYCPRDLEDRDTEDRDVEDRNVEDRNVGDRDVGDRELPDSRLVVSAASESDAKPDRRGRDTRETVKSRGSRESRDARDSRDTRDTRDTRDASQFRPEPEPIVARPERTPILADQRIEDGVEPPRRDPAPRKPTGRERGPLSEMPPPDDNFSAGIF